MEQSTTTARAAMPRVNLLPPEIAEHRRFTRLRLGLAGVLAATVAVIGASYAVSAQGKNEAAVALQVEQDRSSAITQASARYTVVPEVEARTRVAESSLKTAMATEVRWSFFLNELSSVIPADAWLTGLTLTQPVGSEAPAGPVPAASGPGIGGSAPVIASLTYAGVGLSYPAVATWLEAQEAITDSDAPYVTSTANMKLGANQVVEFATTAVINDGAYSHRYDVPQGIRP